MTRWLAFGTEGLSGRFCWFSHSIVERGRVRVRVGLRPHAEASRGSQGSTDAVAASVTLPGSS